MKEQQFARAVATIESYLLDEGFIVRQHDDFSKFTKKGKKARGSRVSGQFSQENFDYFPERSFWLEFRDRDSCIAVMGLRLDPIKPKCLAEIWGEQESQGQQSRVYSKPNKIGKRHAPLAYEIKGKVIYGGEFSIPKKYRRNGYAGTMIFYGLMLAFLRWRDADWCYGLMNEDLARSGFAHRMGFLHNQPRGTDWIVEPKGISANDWLCATDAEGMHHWAGLIAERGLEVFLQHKKA